MPSDFDERARTWDDDPAKVERARTAAAAIRNAVPLDPAMRLLEYGAGTGLLTQFLAGDVGAVALAEPSRGMRDVMAQKIAAGTLPPGARVWDLDLAAGDIPEERFDVIVTLMVLHHIPDLSRVLDAFATLLGDGGHLCIVDLEKEDGSFHEGQEGFDGHDGFARDELAKQLTTAGFAHVQFALCGELDKNGRSYPIFLATCSSDTVR